MALWTDMITGCYFVCRGGSGRVSKLSSLWERLSIHDLIRGKNPPVLPPLSSLFSSGGWARSAACAFLPSEQLPLCLRAAAGERQHTVPVGGHAGREQQKGKFRWGHRPCLMACGLLGQTHDGDVNLFGGTSDGGRWMKKLKSRKIIARFTLYFPVAGHGRSITHWARGRVTPSPPRQPV